MNIIFIVPFLSALLAFVIASIGSNFFLKRLKKKIKQEGLLQTFSIDEKKVQTLCVKTLLEYLSASDTQQLIHEKIDSFLKREFSFLSHFISNSFIEKTSQQLFNEMATTLENMSQKHLLTEKKLQEFLIHLSQEHFPKIIKRIQFRLHCFVALTAFIISSLHLICFLLLQ